jgi:hypothetical protein
MCNRGDLLVSYIYDEISDHDRREVEAHLTVCGDCRAEVDGLRSTRVHLGLWAPPQPELGFRIVSGASAPAPVQALPRRRWAPAFGLAAAAVLVMAAAVSIANIEIRYDGTGGMTVRTGWGRAPDVQQAQAPATGPGAAAAVPASAPPSDFSALHSRIAEIERVLAQGSTTPRVQNASATAHSDAELLRQVRALVREAEERQHQAVSERLLQVVTDFDLQRRRDLAQIQQGLGQMQGLTIAEIATQRDLMQQLIRASSRQER